MYSTIDRLMQLTSEAVDLIAANADHDRVRELANQMNGVLAGEGASNCLLAIAMLMSAVPLEGDQRMAAFGAIVMAANDYAKQAESQVRH